MKKFSFVRIFLVALLAALPLKSFALEISYPPFFLITDATTATGLIKIFYQGMISVGAVVATAFIVISGFKILTSRGNVSATSEARSQILRVLAGIAILIGAILMLRTINPEIALIQIGAIEFPAPPPPVPPTVTCTGPNEAAFDVQPLGRTLDETNVFLNKMDPIFTEPNTPMSLDFSEEPYFSSAGTKSTLGLLQAVVQEVIDGLASCSAGLCLYPDPIPYKTTHRDPGFCLVPLLEDGSCPEGSYHDATSYCGDAHTCTTDVCTGDPCPDRSDANAKLGNPQTDTASDTTVVGMFKALQDFWRYTIKPERDLITECVVRQRQGHVAFLTYGSALISAQQPNTSANEVETDCASKGVDPTRPISPSNPITPCTESTDFFCTNAATSTEKFTRLHLSLDDPTINRNGLLQKEEDLIRNIQGRSFSLPLALRGNGINENFYSTENPNSCSCTHTTATSSSCAGALCNQGDPETIRQCTTNNDNVPGAKSKGCYATTWRDLQKIVDISTRMEELHDALTNEMNHINSLADIELFASQQTTYQGVYIKPCSTAKVLATAVCPRITAKVIGTAVCTATTPIQPTICCPDAYTKNDIIKCENEDFYSCLIASPHP